MQGEQLIGLLWGAQYSTKIGIRCNSILSRLIGASSCSPEHIWVQCRCSGCQYREAVGFADGGNVMSLTEFAQHTCSQPPSLKLFTVAQPGAPNDPVPLLEWLRAANEHMGGDALVRRQLCVFWSGFGDKTDTPNAWRSATIRRIDKATGSCEIKYHDDRRKRSQAFLYLPLTVVHFARCPPPPGEIPRNIADGQLPLPPVLQLLPPPPPRSQLKQQPHFQVSASSVATPPLPLPAFEDSMASAPAAAATANDGAPSPSSLLLAPLATAAVAPGSGATTTVAATADSILKPAMNRPSPSWIVTTAYSMPRVEASPAALGMCSPQPASRSSKPRVVECSELSHLQPARSVFGSSGAFEHGIIIVDDGLSPVQCKPECASEAHAKRSWMTAAAAAGVEAAIQPGSINAAWTTDASCLPTKVLRTRGGGGGGGEGRDAPNWQLTASSDGSSTRANANTEAATTGSTSRQMTSGASSDSRSTGTVSPFWTNNTPVRSGNSNAQALGGPAAADLCHRTPPAVLPPTAGFALLRMLGSGPSATTSSASSAPQPPGPRAQQNPTAASGPQWAVPVATVNATSNTGQAVLPSQLAAAQQQMEHRQQMTTMTAITCPSTFRVVDVAAAKCSAPIGGVTRSAVMAQMPASSGIMTGTRDHQTPAAMGPPSCSARAPGGYDQKPAPMLGASLMYGCNVQQPVPAGAGGYIGGVGIPGRDSSRNGNSIIYRFLDPAMAATIPAGRCERGHDINNYGGAVSGTGKLALPYGDRRYSNSRSSSSSSPDCSAESYFHRPISRPQAGLVPMQPPAAATTLIDGHNIIMLQPQPSSAPPAAATKAVAAVDSDAELDAYLAASFDFLADSEDLDFHVGGRNRWLSAGGSGDTGTNGPVPLSQAVGKTGATGVVMQEFPRMTGGVVPPGSGFGFGGMGDRRFPQSTAWCDGSLEDQRG